MNLLILTYHYFHERGIFPRAIPEHDREFSMEIESFQRHCDALRGRTIAPVDIFDEQQWQQPGNRVLLTIDDGHESILAHAALALDQAGIKPIIHVVVSFVGCDGYLDWPQLQELSRRGYSIQSHALQHRDLTVLPDAELREELSGSRQTIEDKIGAPVSIVALPMGRWSRRVVDMAREVGYEAVLTSFTGINHSRADMRNAKRFQVKSPRDALELESYFRVFSVVRIVGAAKNLAKRLLRRPREPRD